MSVPVIAFFSGQGEVGKTTLVYHLAWMFSDLGVHVVAADLDPKASLTALFLDEDLLEGLWRDEEHIDTVYGGVRSLVSGIGDVAIPKPQLLSEYLALLPGDPLLSTLEDELSSQWSATFAGTGRAFFELSGFWRIMQRTAHDHDADLVLVDLGSDLGSISRAALIASDYVVVPVSPDLFSLQGLRNVGPTLAKWREEWSDRLERKPKLNIDLPLGQMKPLGYIVLQHGVRWDRPVRAYEKWINHIPVDYRKYVLSESIPATVSIQEDPHKLGMLRHYHSLMPMAQEARKPMFHLKPADGAMGAHFQSAQDAYRDFRQLARVIAEKANLVAVKV